MSDETYWAAHYRALRERQKGPRCPDCGGVTWDDGDGRECRSHEPCAAKRIARLRGERDRLAAIVRRLAASDPVHPDGHCGVCDRDLVHRREEHADDCAWRLATEWVAASERSEG